VVEVVVVTAAVVDVVDVVVAAVVLVVVSAQKGVPHAPADTEGTNLHLWHCQPGQHTSHTPPSDVHCLLVGLAQALGSTRS
jgi:hypothetical protein